MDDVTREVVDGVGPDGIDMRLYSKGADELPSVTTILKTRDDDKSNLNAWKDRNDGTGNAADHEHLFWYSRHVGTLGHWHALSRLDDTLEWSADEQQSENELTNLYADEVADDSAREVLYSIMRGDKNKAGGEVSTWGEFYDRHPPYQSGDYYADEIAAHAQRDVEFFADAQERLWSKVGVENIIAVEQFLFEETYGFAGQVDLVYEDRHGYTVVADLKSSSGCYDKHQIQGAAYARAVEREPSIPVDSVDRLEVHRAHPRSGEIAVHTHEDAPGQTGIHTTQYWSDGFNDLWDRFESLIHNFDHYDGVDNSDLFEIEVDADNEVDT